MKSTHKLKANSYYVFESMSSGRSTYFESEGEIEMFKSLFSRYLSKYVEVHRIYLSTQGYNILLRVRDGNTIRSNYIKGCEKQGKRIKTELVDEIWRIVSERMRIFHSVFVKAVNSKRGRKGVLVQRRYRRYYFENVEEGLNYIREMDIGKEIESQENKKFGVSERWKKLVDWSVIRGKKWVESLMSSAFRRYVVPKLINLTIAAHAPPNP